MHRRFDVPTFAIVAAPWLSWRALTFALTFALAAATYLGGDLVGFARADGTDGADRADSADPKSAEPTALEILAEQTAALRPFVKSDVAKALLDAVPELPAVPTPRIAYRNRAVGAALSVAEATAAGLTDSTKSSFRRTELDESFYYFTRYGTPLAFVRPLDLLGQRGLDTLDGIRIADFGFGSIGHLRLLAANGAIVHGIEVDPLLKVLYAENGDTGDIARRPGIGTGKSGRLTLHFGSFPGDADLVAELGDRFDVFISKNTLKNGYIHPAEPVDPRMLVDLGVDDRTFVSAVHRLLVAGGYFMIYNLCPPQSDDRYIPWADGRSPFSNELLESVGFDVLAFDRDDTDAAREMGKLLGWSEQMDLKTDLFGTYTVARKR